MATERTPSRALSDIVRQLFGRVFNLILGVVVVAEESGTARERVWLAAPPGLRRLGLAFPVVEALGDLLGVSLVVELQEAGEDFPACRLADREIL